MKLTYVLLIQQLKRYTPITAHVIIIDQN